MAEGFVNHILAGEWEAHSAGTHPTLSVHPRAIEAMKEVGIDISTGVPESVDKYLNEFWDLVVTVCDHAKETCPAFPRPVKQLHLPFKDPAGAIGTDREIREAFRGLPVLVEVRSF